MITITYRFKFGILENVMTDQETISKNCLHKIENFFSNLQK